MTTLSEWGKYVVFWGTVVKSLSGAVSTDYLIVDHPANWPHWDLRAEGQAYHILAHVSSVRGLGSGKWKLGVTLLL